ncbi:MAG: DUF2971 domain-containing protein [Moraxellaceae bacterium]|nr:DUF2971 domain-containing protein [Moraxellaceae bacterium]
MPYLYRFRSTQALLDKYQELDSQHIYFCPPEDLNDPMEGYKNVFWKGDSVVWTNLLRHYLLNVLKTTSIAAITGQDFTPDDCINLVHQTDHDLPQAPIRDIYHGACANLLRQPEISRLISTLSSSPNEIRRDELALYLRLIHPLVVRIVFNALEELGLAPTKESSALDKQIACLKDRLNDLLSLRESVTEAQDGLFSVHANAIMQMSLIRRLNDTPAQEARWRIFIIESFPNYYLRSLERLIHPDFHVACFVENPTHASMWGTYGDGHKGVCLKFRTKHNTQGEHSIDLLRVNGFSASKDGVVESYDYVSHPFARVNYSDDFPEIDFFESIATLPRFKLESWFVGKAGERSTNAARMLREDKEWRQEYWQTFHRSCTTKSIEWRHEAEYRLTLFSSLTRFDSRESRKLKYRFSDLAGIVFGIKTGEEEKLEIIRIVKKKCQSEGRADFEFLQARYSDRMRKIELVPLSLLSMK